jgi:hypothetical protein
MCLYVCVCVQMRFGMNVDEWHAPFPMAWCDRTFSHQLGMAIPKCLVTLGWRRVFFLFKGHLFLPSLLRS